MAIPASCPHCRGPLPTDRPDCPRCGRRDAPADAASPPRPADGPEPVVGPGDARTVLVVEDDRELVEGLREVLQREGYRVLVAANGIQGREAVYRDRPDLVILDMMMPRMGGFPVLEHFRDKTDAPPIIMITANEGSRHKAYAEMLGVVGYLRKPFAMEALLAAVAGGLAARANPPGGRHRP